MTDSDGFRPTRKAYETGSRLIFKPLLVQSAIGGGGGAIGWRQRGYIWGVYVNGRCTRGRGQLEAPAGKKVGRG